MSKDRVYIDEAMEDLRFLSVRSVIRWCHKYNVRIFKKKGFDQEFVLRFEFEKAKREDPQRPEYIIPWYAVKKSHVTYINLDGKNISRRPSGDTKVS